jgi:dTMP kinase
MARIRGKYILIEGTDGAGKTTQKELVKKALLARGEKVIDVYEPGGTPIGDQLRLIIKDASLARGPETNLDLFTVARRELVDQVIRPALKSGKHVISDRNWFSTIAYQGFGEGVDVAAIVEKSRAAMGDLFLPDIGLVISVPIEIAEDRMGIRSTSHGDAFERKGREFFEKVHEGYLWCAQEYKLPVIDGSPSIEAVNKMVMKHVDKFLNNTSKGTLTAMTNEDSNSDSYQVVDEAES